MICVHIQDDCKIISSISSLFNDSVDCFKFCHLKLTASFEIYKYMTYKPFTPTLHDILQIDFLHFVKLQVHIDEFVVS